MKLLLKSLALAALIFLSFNSTAQTMSWNDRILPPAGTVESRLDNGLSYVLMPNDSPSRTIECRLIFRAGSVLETEENRGAAHFLEHMAFGGTRHFPGRKLVEYLESLGAQYGENINAYTGYDRTIYMFTIPSDESSYLDNALLILKDWLVDITIDPKKVEGEKGIIIEELRGYDTGDEFYDLKIGTGLYSKGIPLGTEEDIKKITPEILRDFHDRWYTLGQATVVLVGDIDVEDAERRIEKTFGSLKATSSPDYSDYPHEYAPGTTYAEVQDTLLSHAALDVMVPHPCVLRDNLGDAVQNARCSMLVSAISKRLYASGSHVSVSNSWYLADKDHFCVSVSGKDRQEVSRELKRTITELYSIAENGFSGDELRYYVDSFLGHYRLAKGMVNSSVLCTAIEDAVLFDDRVITDRAQHEWIRERLAETASADLQAILGEWLEAAESCRLAAWKYNPETSSGFTVEEIDSLWNEAKAAPREKFTFVAPEPEEKPQMPDIPEFLVKEAHYDPAMIVSRSHYPETKVTDVVLSNGFRLVLRPTKDEEHRIQLQIIAPGGMSKAPVEDFPQYEGLAGYMELGGIEGLDDEDFGAILMGRELGLLVAVEWYWHGIIASGPACDSRLLFNLVKAKMTAPSLNYNEFQELKQDELESFGEESYLSRLMKTDYRRQLDMKIDSLMGNVMYGRRTVPTREDIESLDLDRIAAFYRELYSNPDGMTCVICGDFDADSLLREAVPIFGSMPAGRERQKMGDSMFSLPSESGRYEFPNANETQTVFDLLQFGHYEPSLRTSLELKLMKTIIRNRLISVLREGKSLVYSPYVSLFYNAYPDGIYYFDMNASVDRKNTAEVYDILMDILAGLQKKKVSKKELETIQSIFIMNRRMYLEDNATASWKGQLVGQVKNNEDVADFEEYEKILKSITPKDIKRAFGKYIDVDRNIVLSLGGF